jgi:hypothetical protein
MTKEQVIALATEVWQTSHWTSEQIKRLERFALLVGNAKLEEAAQKAFSWNTAMTDTLAKEIREMKEKL